MTEQHNPPGHEQLVEARDRIIKMLWEKQFEFSAWAGKFHLIRKDSLEADYGALADKILASLPSPDREEIIELRAALRAMADAYERRVRTGLTAEEIAKEPWRCAEYIEVERLLKLKLRFSNEWLRRKIASDPDIETEAGRPLFSSEATSPDRELVEALAACERAHFSKLEEIAGLMEELEALRAERDRLREALEFYADPESYWAIAIFGDPPCGGFADDYSDDHGHPKLDGPRYGKRARAALNAHGGEK